MLSLATVDTAIGDNERAIFRRMPLFIYARMSYDISGCVERVHVTDEIREPGIAGDE